MPHELAWKYANFGRVLRAELTLRERVMLDLCLLDKSQQPRESLLDDLAIEGKAREAMMKFRSQQRTSNLFASLVSSYRTGKAKIEAFVPPVAKAPVENPWWAGLD